MPSIINLVLTTELEAVNAMLSAIGEEPITGDPEDSTSADVVMALNILRNVTREVQSMSWRFNTEFGYELAPQDTLSWLDSAGVTTLLNIFVPPAGLVAFTVTPIAEQQGSRLVDTVIRPARVWDDASLELVFYDRMRARDGFPADLHPYLYINPVWLFNFEHMPESARRYCTVKAARQFVQEVVGSDTLKKFTEQDERFALRTLKREQGENDEYNLLQNTDVLSKRGWRRGGMGGILDGRKNRNST